MSGYDDFLRMVLGGAPPPLRQDTPPTPVPTPDVNAMLSFLGGPTLPQNNPPAPAPQPTPDYAAMAAFLAGPSLNLNTGPATMPQPQQTNGGGGRFGFIGDALGGAGNALGGAASAVGNAAGSAIGGAANIAGNVGGAVLDAAPTSLGDAGNLAMGALSLLDTPRRAVVADIGQGVYEAAVRGDNRIDIDFKGYNAIAEIYSWLPGENAYDAWLNTEGNRERAIDAYENGYDYNDDGVIDFTGAQAVWELIAGDTGTIGRIIGDVAFDPLTVVGIGGGQKLLKGAAKGVTEAGQAIRAGDEANLLTRAAGAGIEGLGRAGQAVEYAANDLIGDLVFGGARLGARGFSRATGLGNLGTEAASTAVGAADGAAPVPATQIDEAGNLVPDPAVPAQPNLVGRAIDATVGNAYRYLSEPSVITKTNRANRATQDALHQLSQADQDLFLSPQWRNQLAEENARRSHGVFDDPIPNPGDIDPLAPPSSSTEFGPGAWGAKLPGTEDLGYLAPTEKGSRLVDFFGRDLFARDPDAFARFTQEYAPAAQAQKQTVDKIDAIRNKALKSGKTDEDLMPFKTIASAQHVVDELVPLVRKHGGDDAIYRFMNNPISDPAINVLRDEAGKVLNRADVTAARPNVRTVVEQAVFGVDDQAATDARYWMRRQGGQWAKTADETKRLRSELRGPDSVAGRGKAATDELLTSPNAGMLPDDDPGVQAWRDRQWMAQQEAKSLTDMGQPVPPDLQAILDEPRPVAAVDQVVTPADPYEGVRFGDARTPAQQQALGEIIERRNAAGLQPPAQAMPTGVTGFQHKAWTADEALAEMVRTGELHADDMAELLKTVDITVGEGKNAVTSQKRVIDVYAGYIKDGLDPGTAYRKTLSDVRKAAPEYYQNLPKAIKWLPKLWDEYLGYVRETLMFSVTGGPRGILTDTLGDTIQLSMKGDTTGLSELGGLRGLSTSWNVMRGKSDEVLSTTRTGQTINRLGVIEPARYTNIDDLMGREQVGRAQDMSVQRMIRKITRSDKAAEIGAAINPTQSKFMRDMRSSLDHSRRFAVYGNYLARNLADENRAFFREILERGNTEGVDDFALIQRLTGQQSEPLIDGMDNWLNRLPAAEFSPRDVRKAAMEVGYSEREASRLANSWRKHVTKLNREALKDSDSKLFTYESTRADEILKRTFLFHYWLTRATPQYLEASIKNPEMAVNFYRAANGLERYAEEHDLPRAAQGLLRVWNSPGGYSLFMNAVATFSTMFMFREQAHLDGDAGMFERIVKNGPGMLSPIIAGAATLVGVMDEGSLDPTMTYTVRNTLGAIAQWAVANGYLDPVGIEPHLMGTPYQTLVNNAWSQARDFTNKASFGLISKLDAGNNQATIQSMIQANIADSVRAEFDIPADLPIDQWSPDAQNAYVEAVHAFQYGRSDNAIANEALREYANGNLLRRAGGMVVPGSLQMRSDVRDDVMVEANAGDEQAIQERNLMNAGSPLATSLAVGEANYRAVGAEVDGSPVASGRGINNIYNAIKFPGNTPPGAITVGDQTYTPENIALMTPGQREQLADAWLSAQSVRGTNRGAFFDARDAVLEQPINQPYGEYLNWRNNAYDLGATTVMNASPVLQQFARNLPEATRNDPERLQNALFSPQGYALTQGQPGSVYDPVNLDDPFDPTQVNPVDMLTGGGAGTGGSTPAKSRESRLSDNLRDYNMDVAMFNQNLQAVTGGPWTLDQIEQANPMLRQAIMQKIYSAGLNVPRMPREVELYTMWSQSLPPGSDKSFSAFYAWYDTFAAAGQPVPALP